MSQDVITKIESPEDLRNYCMRALGEPVINIEIDEQQIFDRISDTIKKFVLRHYNGIDEVWEFYKVTQTDIDNGYITLPDQMLTVLDIIDPIKDAFGTGDEFDQISYRLANSDFFDYTWTLASDMFASWIAFNEKLEMIKRFFAPNRSMRYNGISKRMTVFGNDWKRVGYFFIVHGYKSIDITDPTTIENVYDNEWVRRYATALIGRQWGRNVMKYDGIQLPGNVIMKGSAILQYWDDEVKKLDEEYIRRYQEPIDFFMA